MKSIYIHIPYCKQKCLYCDFNSYSNKEDTINKIKKYSYYSIINSYKDVFKTVDNNYKEDQKSV